jgi:twitching motility two-component system response regulator PilH
MPAKKILIVDDSATDRQFFVDALTREGYDVITAQNGEEGVYKSRVEQPDLILMDIVMPGMDGYKATRTIVRDEATKHIPVIICTSRNQDTDRLWGMRRGAKDFLVKPIREKDLIAKVAGATTHPASKVA